jgi:hypothetical protein
MHESDVWLYLECPIDGNVEIVCAMFGRMHFPVRPIIGEKLTFWPASGAAVQFNVVTAAGIVPVHYVSAEIDNVSHNARPGENGSIISTYVSCWPLQVATTTDARQAVELLQNQHGFERDPYGVNKL